MKYLIILTFLMALFVRSNAQPLLTIGEVFDYEIGDEFQTKWDGWHTGIYGPRTDRYKVIGKSYSTNNDTVLYTIIKDGYQWVDLPPATCFYWSDTINAIYTHLDSAISYYDDHFFMFTNSVHYNGPDCGILSMNGWNYNWGPYDWWKTYGKGLGLISQGYVQIPTGEWTILFYYKKNGISCGTPDLTGVGIEETISEADFTITCAPATTSIHLINRSDQPKYRCELFNSVGQLILQTELSGEDNYLYISHFKAGLYIIHVFCGNKQTTLKFIKI
jgi:hypothetical protein